MLFDTSLNDDITYLLEEIGYNVKINNVDASAIINNSSIEKKFDDKKIICHEELKRGMYINYNDLNFILLNEVNDKRYKNYYKGVMRNCNFDLKFILDDKLYLFHSFIESDKFALNSSQQITLSADTITVTLPSTTITEQIALNMRFVSMGRVWEINGIDKTKLGLISLICKIRATDKIADDMENEIANRFVGGADKLKGNITPIMPFGEPGEEPIAPEPEEPEEIEITGESEISMYDEDVEYSINTDKEVEWSLSRLDLVKITKIEGNKCYIDSGNNKKNIGIFELIATIDGEVYKKKIELVYM